MFFVSMEGATMAASNARCELPKGDFAGEGKWSDFTNGSGSYQVTTTVGNEVITTTYRFGDNIRTLKMLVGPKVDSKCEINVEEGGQIIGSGACSDMGCTYRIKQDDLRLEENFMFQSDKLFRIGFKIAPSKADKGIISWQEVLVVKS